MVQEGGRWCRMGHVLCGMMGGDADGCMIVPNGAGWFRMVQNGGRSCRLVHDSVEWCRIVPDGAEWWVVMQIGA